MNKGTLGGIGIAISGIAVGLYLDGGHVSQMLQPTAALIVFGGTLGAVMVQFPFSVVRQAARQLKDIFIHSPDPTKQLVDDMMRYAMKARKHGLLSLDADLNSVRDRFLRKALMLAVDGAQPPELRQSMELEMIRQAENEDQIPKVFEAAGGFAPTIGILGAVIGLIQVMQHLDNIDAVGRGIAVAFVATIYGVGSANIFFLPCAGRIKTLMGRKQVLREMMLDGVVAIVDRTNPRVLEANLNVYLNRSTVPVPEKKRVAV